MLKNRTESRNITVYGVIGEKHICQFYANINTEDIENMDVGRSILDKEAYKINRTQMAKDQADFENEVYALQDQLIADQVVGETEGETI